MRPSSVCPLKFSPFASLDPAKDPIGNQEKREEKTQNNRWSREWRSFFERIYFLAGIKKEGEKKKEQSVESVKSEVKKVEKIDTVFSKFPLLDKDMIC